MNDPKISVIIPLYNHEKYINEAVCSVLEQTFSDFELIIINDGSIDRSEEIVKQIKDERIKYYYQENKGAHNTINRGIKLAKGEYISILNSDDVYDTNRFEESLKILDVDSNINAVFSHIELIDDQGNHIRYKKGAEDNWVNHDPKTSFKDENNIILDLLAGNFLITTSNLFCRKSVFQDIGFFQNLKYTHDYEFFLRLCYHFKVRIIDMPFLKYRIHPDNKIKENEAETDFELGLVISNFFLNYDLKEFFPENNIYTTMVKFLNSINTYNSERMIMTLVLFGIKYKIHSQFFNALTENPENPFRKVCIDHFKTYPDMWKNSQDAWAKWDETNKRLIETEKILEQALAREKTNLEEAHKALVTYYEKEQVLKQVQHELIQVYNSYTYRLGSIFRDARYSKKKFLLFPLRFIWFFLPLRIKGPPKKILYRIQKRFFIKKQKIKHIINKQWPKNRPLISVVIYCYNNGQYFDHALNSVLAQTWRDFEIIVVNVGSDYKDKNRIINQARKAKIRIIRRRNLELPIARNRGIKAAKGKYICCLDADDKIAPTYLEKCLYRLEVEGLDICGSWQQNFGGDKKVIKSGEFNLTALIKSNNMINACVFRKKLWKKIGGYDQEMTEGCEDWEFWIRMAKAGARASIISETLFYYRKHGNRAMIDATLENHDSIVHKLRAKYLKSIDKTESQNNFNDFYEKPVKNRFVNLARSRLQKNDQINVLITMPYLTFGGAERIVSQICSNFSKHGFNITILTTVPSKPEFGDTTSWFEPYIKEIYHLPRFLLENMWKDFIFYLLATRNIQILWNVGSSIVYALMPEVKTRFPSIKIIDLLFNEVGHVINNCEYDYCIDLTITENRKVESWLLAQRADPDRIKIIPNGVDLEKYRPCFEPNTQKEIHSWSDRGFIIGFFGRYSEEKGPDIFIEIASRLKHRHDIHFVMAGDGPLCEQINRRIKDDELPGRVQLLGIVDVSEQLPQCDIVVVPSRLDGRPNIVLESLAMGIPVIASNVGGLSEMVVEGYTGFLCNPTDVEAFADKITIIVDDSSLRENMKLNARKEAEKKFDIKKMLDSYVAVFSSITR